MCTLTHLSLDQELFMRQIGQYAHHYLLTSSSSPLHYPSSFTPSSPAIHHSLHLTIIISPSPNLPPYYSLTLSIIFTLSPLSPSFALLLSLSPHLSTISPPLSPSPQHPHHLPTFLPTIIPFSPPSS